jgi:hypothetical protein
MTVVGRSLVMPYKVIAGRFERTNDDALRSMNKYVAVALGGAWEVRTAAEESTYRTPFARVAFAGPAVYEGGPAYVDVTRPLTAHSYPDYPEGGTIEQSKHLAEQLEEVLFQAFRVGVGKGEPERIPLYNFNGVALDGGGSNFRGDHDYMRIVRGSLSIEQLADPTDERWISVIVNMRVTWRRAGRRIEGKPVQSLEQQYVAL